MVADSATVEAISNTFQWISMDFKLNFSMYSHNTHIEQTVADEEAPVTSDPRAAQLIK